MPARPSAQWTAVPFMLAPHICLWGCAQIQGWAVAASVRRGGLPRRREQGLMGTATPPAGCHLSIISHHPISPLAPHTSYITSSPIYPQSVESSAPLTLHPTKTHIPNPSSQPPWACHLDLLVQFKHFSQAGPAVMFINAKNYQYCFYSITSDCQNLLFSFLDANF